MDGKVLRLENKEAESLVNEGKASYTTKTQWKVFTGRWKPESLETGKAPIEDTL